jgi:hypothetical protein
MSVPPSEGSGTGVVGAEVRVLADVLGLLFERDRQLAIALNTAQRRLLSANERLTIATPVGAVLCGAFGARAADVGVAERRPAVLDADSPVAALGEVADSIRRAFADYQYAAQGRRDVAADIGEATVRLADALMAAGFSDAQARRADVRALRHGVYREG